MGGEVAAVPLDLFLVCLGVSVNGKCLGYVEHDQGTGLVSFKPNPDVAPTPGELWAVSTLMVTVASGGFQLVESRPVTADDLSRSAATVMN